MDKQGFRSMLQARKLNEAQIASSIAIAERFETYLDGRPATDETAWAFSKQLIAEGKNTGENYIALVRYCLFVKNHDLYVAFLELVDGGEVGENLHRLVAERFGAAVRDEVFAGIGVVPFGTPTPEKPAMFQPVITRLEVKVGKQACADFLSSSLRDLPDEYFLEEREKFRQAGGIDAYLVRRKEDFIAALEVCLRENRPFFAQPVTQEVIDYVRSEPEMGGGRREGAIVYEVKIPFMTADFLAETDPVRRRYLYCHCPWARETIKGGGVHPAETFCNCSGGFHKKPFEAAFGKPIKVDVLESVLLGGDRCRFAIHLPAEAIPRE
jgi:hypothetical protein